MNPIISPDDNWTLWALILSGTALAIWLEQRFRWAARLSGPVLALLIAMLLSNAGVMPSQSGAYDFVEDYLVPLAIPLLLFRANIVHIVRATGRLFLAFHLSAVGTVVGTVVATRLLKGRVPSPALEQAAGMMAASYTGGSVNFMAIKTSYSVPASVADPLIVADNFVMALLFLVLLAAAASALFRRWYPHPHCQEWEPAQGGSLAAAHWRRKEMGLLDIAKALAVAFVVVAGAGWLRKLAVMAFGDVSSGPLPLQMLQVLCTNPFVLITAVSLTVATLLHRPMAGISGPEELGTLMLYLFLFCIGLPASLKAVLMQAPLFFVFCGVIALVNLLVSLGLGKLFRLNLEEILLSVNANLGGAPSAAAMAISAGWPRLVLPGILVGIWGYVIGTPMGVLVMQLMQR